MNIFNSELKKVFFTPSNFVFSYTFSSSFPIHHPLPFPSSFFPFLCTPSFISFSSFPFPCVYYLVFRPSFLAKFSISASFLVAPLPLFYDFHNFFQWNFSKVCHMKKRDNRFVCMIPTFEQSNMGSCQIKVSSCC